MTGSFLHVLGFAQVVLLSAAIPLSAIAALGARGTRWGRVLTPLPFIEASYVLGLGMGLLHYDTGIYLVLQSLVLGVGVLLTTVVAVRLARLASGGVRA